MMRKIVSFGLLLAIVSYSQAEPRIISRPEIISAYPKEAAVLKCQIANPQINLTSWSSVTYNFKIFKGSQLLATDAVKYSLINILGGQMYNLQILNIEKSDQGFYKCAIERTGQEIITQLKVLDRPSNLLPEGTPLNVTDCCLVEGVSKSCLPACYPGQIDLQKFSLVTNCGTVGDLKVLSKCFTGGSNHDNCCLNMKVNASCLDICHNAVSDNLSTDYFNRCYAENVIKDIFSCFQKGSVSLPSEPTAVKAEALCEAGAETILISWSEPAKNPQLVTGYKIMYKTRMQETYNTVLVRDPKVHKYQLKRTESQILSGTNYIVHVSALAYEGISFESADVFVSECYITATSRNTDRQTGIFTTSGSTDGQTGIIVDLKSVDDDASIELAFGVGVSAGVICVIAIVLLIISVVCRKRSQGFKTFNNPNFNSSREKKLPVGDDKHMYDKKKKIMPPGLYTAYNATSGKPVTNSNFEKSAYYSDSPTTALPC